MLTITNRKVEKQIIGVKFTNDRGPLTVWKDLVGLEYAGMSAGCSPVAEAEWPIGPVTLFIHGFNNSWQKAHETTELISQGLGGEVVLFSWVSEDRVDILDYEIDRARARASAKDLYLILRKLGDIDIIAHSMGNYVVQKCLTAPSPIKIRHLAMVAADVDNNCLKSLAFETLIGRGKVYHCNDDGALVGSSALHGLEIETIFPRLGQTGPLFGKKPDNFEVEDCTKMLGHVLNPIEKHGGYFREPEFYKSLKGFLAE